MTHEEAYINLHLAIQRHYAVGGDLAFGPHDQQLWQTASVIAAEVRGEVIDVMAADAGAVEVIDGQTSIEEELEQSREVQRPRRRHSVLARKIDQAFPGAANEDEIRQKLNEHPEVPDAVKEEWDLGEG